ncbi:MAG: TolC family protein [Acidobacteriota bacterium]
MPAALDVDGAVREALERNPGLALRRAEVDRAEADLRSARIFLPSDPVLELAKTTDSPYAGTGEGGPSIALAQEVEVAKRGPRKDAALARLLAARAAHAQARRELAADVRKAFFALRTARRSAELAGQAVELNEQLLDAAERRLQAGDISELERDLARVDLEATRVARSASVLAQRRTEIELGRLLGRTGETIEIAGTLPPTPPADLAALLAGARHDSPEARSLEQTERAAEADLRLARRGYVPDASVRLELSRDRSVFLRDDVYGDPGITRRIDRLEDVDRLATLTIGISLPVTGRVAAEVVARQADLDVARQARLAREGVIEAGVRSATAAVEQASETVRRLAALEPVVTSNLEMLRSAYGAGRISLSDYLVQKDRALGVQKALAEAEGELGNALADLDLAAGRDVAFTTPGEGR